jgi:hypothetical protein
MEFGVLVEFTLEREGDLLPRKKENQIAKS